MKLHIKDTATVHSGIYAKPNISGDAIYLQVGLFDSLGRLYSGITPNVTIESGTSKHLLAPGDVLFAAKGTNNFALEYNPAIGRAIASSTFLILKTMKNNKQVLLPGYLAWYLNHPNSQAYLKAFAKGSSIPSISKKTLEEMEIQLPSLDIQQQILNVQRLRNKEKVIAQKLEALREQLIQHQLIIAAQG